MEINQKIDRIKAMRLERRKLRYDLARSLGVSSEAATVMAGWSEKRIREFSKKQSKENRGPNAKN